MSIGVERNLFLAGSSENNLRKLPYRQSRSVMNPKCGAEFSMSNQEDLDELYDVFLEVNAKTRPQRVPFTSVRSNLTNLPVVGHPLPVEILEDNYIDGLVRNGNSKNNYVPEYEGAQQTGGGKHLKSRCISSNTTTKLRKSVPSSKKIRKLSSIIGLNRLNEGEARIFVEGIVNYAIACIPIKVVYNQMNASLKGQMGPPKRVVKLGKC